MNFFRLDNFSVWYRSYAFVDCDEYYADQIFIDNKIKVKFGKEFKDSKSAYRMIFCKVRKRDEEKFLEAISELRNKMILMGYTDYEEQCQNICKRLKSN